MFNFDKILEQWYKTTNRSVDSNSIRLGVESDWTCRKAKDFLQLDPTGMLSIIALRSAFKEYLKEHKYTCEQLLNGAWETARENIITLQSLLYDGEFGDIYKTMMQNITGNLNVLENKYTINDIESIDTIDKIIYTATEEFNKKLKHEQFDIGGKKHNVGRVLPKMLRFEHFKEFIYLLRNTSADDFICFALIDRTAETCDTEYDKKFDTFFAIGIKNNGNIYTISDRVTFSSLEHFYKTRNPARDFEHKVDYSYFPYYNIDNIKESFNHSQTLLLADKSGEDKKYNEMFGQHFSIEDKVYIAILITLAYDKYFTDTETYNYPLQYFTSELKFLQPGEQKENALTEYRTIVNLPDKDITYDTYVGKDNVYNTGLYDYLLDAYKEDINKNDLIKIHDSIISLDKINDHVWWLTRKHQAETIKKKLNENFREKEDAVYNWINDNLSKHATNLFNYIINTAPYDDIDNNYAMSEMCHPSNPENKPLLWKVFCNGEPLHTSSISVGETSKYNSKYIRNKCYCESEFGTIVYQKYQYGIIEGILMDDNDNRKYCIELIMRSHTDMERFFNVPNEELPLEIRRHFASRLNWCTAMAWKPYNGNSILDFTDPMNDIKDPYDEIMPKVKLIVSKSMLNKMVKKQNGTE